MPELAHAEHAIQPDIWSILLKYLAPEGGTGISPPLARPGETERSNHAAIINAVFKIYPSMWSL